MDKKSLIAFALIGLILFLWPVYNKKILKIEPVRKNSQKSIVGDSLAIEPRSPEIKEETKSQKQTVSAAQKKQVVPEEIINVDTDLFEGKISSIGGGTILSWKLKEYKKANGDLVELIPEGSRGNLGFTLDIPGGPVVDLSQADFYLKQDNKINVDSEIVRDLTFAYEIQGWGVVEKTLSIRNQYDLKTSFSFVSDQNIRRKETYSVRWNDGLQPTEQNIKEEAGYHQAYALQGGELTKIKKDGTGVIEGQTNWVAIRNKYFMSAIIPFHSNGIAAQLKTKDEVSAYQEAGGKSIEWKNYMAEIYLQRSDSLQSAEAIVYLGPLDYPSLKEYGVDLQKTLDFGWIIIRIFCIPFLYVLQWLGKTTGNYGWAIIIFSIGIKVVLYPLTRKSFQSMRAMQELQPKMNSLKEKYKDDPQRMNQEVMKLYKDNKVNPMGGCLPMALQMPVLFALFRLFRSTIMFRQAPFLWIKDLAGPDALMQVSGFTLNILPVLMCVSTIVQQKLSTQDPRQKMMAYMMPVFLLFVFYKFSSGLNLYYFMFNVLTIAQELLAKRSRAAEE